jgi:hypothetical protein
MPKKINSEYSVKTTDSNFNIVLGTSNKKNPEVIYTSLTTYITPSYEDFDELFLTRFDKVIKSYLRELLTQNDMSINDTIVVVDIASNRMMCGKPSFLDIQIHIKLKKDILTLNNANFKVLSEMIYNKISLNVAKYIEHALIDKDFNLSKTKNNTIYTEI